LLAVDQSWHHVFSLRNEGISMLTIYDIMTAKAYMVDAASSAEEAAWGLTTRNIGNVPARDSAGNLVGVLTRAELVAPEPAQWIKGEATIGDLMDPEVVTLYTGEPAMAAVAEMAKRNVERIIVLDDDSMPTGIVTPMDVVRALARGETFAL
jgi:predicted transcriptional regulator